MNLFLYIIVFIQINVCAHDLKIPVSNYAYGTFDITKLGNYGGIQTMSYQRDLQFVTGDMILP